METVDIVNKHTMGLAKEASGLEHDAVHEIDCELRHLLADTFALYIKTKSFHWHMKGRHFRDYHLLLDEHADQIFGITDDVAERARKLGANTLRSIGDIARHQRLQDCDLKHITPEEILNELRSDNRQLTGFCAPPMQSASVVTTFQQPV